MPGSNRIDLGMGVIPLKKLCRQFSFLTVLIMLIMALTVPAQAASNYYANSTVKKAKNTATATISWKNGKHTVTSFGQDLWSWNLKGSGCGYCCAATVVRLYGQTSSSAKKTPTNMYVRAQKLSKSNPSSLGIWGMANVFDYFGVPYKLYYSYPFNSQPDLVYNHLKKGGMVVLWTCQPGMGAYALHSVVLCGLDEKGNVVVANSAKGHARFELYTKAQIWDHMRAANSGSAKYYKSAAKAKKAYANVYYEVGSATARGIFLIG